MTAVPVASASNRGVRRNPKTASGFTLLDLALLAVSAAGMALAFPAPSLWFLVIPSLALLLGVLDRVGPLRATVYAFAWGMGFMMPLISWMQIATDGTWLAWVALAGAQAFFIGLFGLSFSAMGVWKWARSIWGEALGGAVLWVAFEEIRSRVPYGGFAWGKLSYPQVDSPLVAFAPIGGEVLVAFVVVVIAVLLRRAFAVAAPLGQTSVPARFSSLFIAIALFVVPIAVKLPSTQQAGAVTVAVIQGNVEVPAFQTFSEVGKVTSNHARVTDKMISADAQPDVIFWGEHSVDRDPRVYPEVAAIVAESVDAAGVPIVVGFMEEADTERKNWVGVWEPKSGLSDVLYGKQHPVPWGEYVPMREISQRLATAAAQVSVDMVPVNNPALLDVPLADGRELPIVVGICFEVAYEPIISEGVQLGGQLIVIPTNNAQFLDSAESVQQLQMARFRAAEFSRSTLQVSTNGVSAIIRPDGSVYAQSAAQTADFLVASVPLRTTLTPSAKMGELPARLAMGLGLGLAACSLGAYLYGRSLWRFQQRAQSQNSQRPSAQRPSAQRPSAQKQSMQKQSMQ